MKIGFGSKDIGTLNWASLAKLNSLGSDKAEQLLVPFRANYVLPQLMAFLGGKGITLIRNSEGKVSIAATLRGLNEVFESSQLRFDKGGECTPQMLAGILAFLVHPSRKNILPDGASQVKPEWVRFGSAVPLFMSAFKEFRNLKYSEWDLKDELIHLIVSPDMLELMKFNGAEVGWDNETLCEYREIARTVKTGAKAGTLRHINSTTSISKVGDNEFDSLPKFVKLALCQTWVWQPSMYTPMGIYNINDIDAKQEPLVSTEVFKKSESITSGELPW